MEDVGTAEDGGETEDVEMREDVGEIEDVRWEEEEEGGGGGGRIDDDEGTLLVDVPSVLLGGSEWLDGELVE